MSLAFKGWWEDLTKFGVVNLQYFVWILICWRLWELWRLGGSWWRNNWRGEGWWWCQGANWQWVTGVGPKLQLFLWCKISWWQHRRLCGTHAQSAWILHSRFWVPLQTHVACSATLASRSVNLHGMKSCLVWSIRVKLVCEWLCFFWEMKSITFTVCSFYLQLVCLND
jgi:hypothetical protein